MFQISDMDSNIRRMMLLLAKLQQRTSALKTMTMDSDTVWEEHVKSTLTMKVWHYGIHPDTVLVDSELQIIFESSSYLPPKFWLDADLKILNGIFTTYIFSLCWKFKRESTCITVLKCRNCIFWCRFK